MLCIATAPCSKTLLRSMHVSDTRRQTYSKACLMKQQAQVIMLHCSNTTILGLPAVQRNSRAAESLQMGYNTTRRVWDVCGQQRECAAQVDGILPTASMTDAAGPCQAAATSSIWR